MKRHLIPAIMLLSASCLGAALAISKGVENKAIETKADANYALTVDASAWNDSTHITYIYAFKENAGNHWYESAYVSSGIYNFNIDTEAFDTIVVVRIETTKEGEGNWDKKVNQTQNISVDTTRNRIRIEGLNKDACPYAYIYHNTIASNTVFYVDATTNQNWWGDGSAKTYLDFVNGDTHTVKEMTKHRDRAGSKTYAHFYSVDIGASAIEADMLIVIRGTGFSGTGWDGTAYNQTSDIVFTSSNAGYTALVLGEDSGNVAHTFQAKDDAFIANAYGKYFLSLDICKDEGGVKNGYIAYVGNSGQAHQTYDNMRECLSNANYIKNISNEGTDSINRAMLRYDTVIYKQDLTNWMDRVPLQTPSGVFYEPTNAQRDSSFPLIASIAGVAILGVAGYGLLKARKKEE